jgi:hypothetical protein
MVFVDLKRAYDSINRAKLWTALESELNIPTDLIRIIRNMYIDSKGIIYDTCSNNIHEFLANMGVKQGDGASPELFLLFFDRVYPYLK